MNEKYFSDYEWELNYPNENKLLISGPGKLEILIDNLDFSLSVKTTHDWGEGIEQLFVSYPIEVKSSYSKDNYNIQVITTENGINYSARLHIGSKVGWDIPFDFARQLQSALLGKSVI